MKDIVQGIESLAVRNEDFRRSTVFRPGFAVVVPAGTEFRKGGKQ